MISIKVTKTGSLLEALQNRKAILAQKVEAGVRAMGEYILQKSRDLVPTDITALKVDSHLHQEGNGFQTQIFVGYGTLGFTMTGISKDEGRHVIREPAKYAMVVHERTDVHHNYGQAKFLVTPTVEDRQILKDLLMSYVRTT